MKRILRKISKILFGLVFIVSSIFSFGGCDSTGPIPDGEYEFTDIGFFGRYVYTENRVQESYWRIEGDNAEHWCSGSLGYKGKIVEQGGAIYFRGYKYLVVFDAIFFGNWTKKGTEDIYLVEYNAEEKSIIVELYTIGE